MKADLVIRGGTIVDGSDLPGNVAVHPAGRRGDVKPKSRCASSGVMFTQPWLCG